MTIGGSLALYFIIWWTVLFAILPWGNRAHEEYDKGLAGSAPRNPRIKQKFLITGVIATVIWAGICLLIIYDVVDLFEMGRDMAVEDYGQ